MTTPKLPRSYAAMEEVAAHYGIPSINFGLEVARLEAAGKLVFKGDKPKTDADKTALGERILFSPDAVHPYTDTGHQLYLEAFARSFGLIRAAGKAGPHELGAPLAPDNWEAAKLLPLDRARLSSGWHKLDPATNHLARSFSRRLPELWAASQPGETIQLRFRGPTVAIYDLLGPDCGQVAVHLDDQPPVTRLRFDSFSTYHRLGTLFLGTGLANTLHTLRVEILPDLPDKAAILSQRGEKMDDPKRFDGRTWYAGALLLVGDLVD